MIRPRRLLMSLRKSQQKKAMDAELEESSRTGNFVLKVILGGIAVLTFINMSYWNSAMTETDKDIDWKKQRDRERAREEGRLLMKKYEMQQKLGEEKQE